MSKIVEVTWIDAEHYSEHWPDNWKGEIEEITTVGYLLEQTAKTLTLAMTLKEDKETPGGVFKIPRACVVSIKEYGSNNTEKA